MEELIDLANFCKGYWIHLKKFLMKATALIERHHNNTAQSDDLTDLRTWPIMGNLDIQILKNVQNKEKLANVCEVEEIKELISTNIAHI